VCSSDLGARNAACLAARMIAIADPDVAASVDEFRREMAEGGS